MSICELLLSSFKIQTAPLKKSCNRTDLGLLGCQKAMNVLVSFTYSVGYENIETPRHSAHSPIEHDKVNYGH